MTSTTTTSTRRMPIRLLQAAAIGLVLALLAMLVIRVVTGDAGTRLAAAIENGERPRAPALKLTVIWPRTETWPAKLRGAVADGTLTLAELRGYPVVLNFWASWCVPCKEEAPALAASARAHAGEVLFLGIDVQDLTGPARRFLRRYEVPYVSVRDSDNQMFNDYGLTGVPETYYVDPDGRLLAHDVGGVSRAELERSVAVIAP